LILLFICVSLTSCSVLQGGRQNSQATQVNVFPTMIGDDANETPLPSFRPGLIEATPKTVLPPEATPLPEAEEQPGQEALPSSEGRVVLSPGSTGEWFVIHPGDPKVTANFAQPELGCNWMGVGGQVLGLNEEPLSNLVIQLGGNLNGTPVENLALTGGNTQLGPGGYLLTISDDPAESIGTLWVAIFDTSGVQVSNRIFLHTYADCEKNFISLNFEQVNLSTLKWFFIPVFFFESP
jgi:hypothetical protein